MSAKTPLPASLVEVPGVGVCQNDLHFMATMVTRGMGVRSPTSALDIAAAAVTQAVLELRLIAEAMENKDLTDPTHGLIHGICDRLEAAAESAEILWKLYQLPDANGNTPGGEAAE